MKNIEYSFIEPIQCVTFHGKQTKQLCTACHTRVGGKRNYSQPRHLRSLRCATLICTIAPARITDYRSLAALAYLRTDALAQI